MGGALGLQTAPYFTGEYAYVGWLGVVGIVLIAAAMGLSIALLAHHGRLVREVLAAPVTEETENAR
jgi:hypothetical protein